MRWAGPAFVLLLSVALPLLAPPAWNLQGRLPDVAVLAVVYLGFHAPADRAAWLGIALGALASCWSPEPFWFRPFTLGAAGWISGQIAAVLHRESVMTHAAVAALAVLAVRGAEFVVAAISWRDGTPWTSGELARVAGSVFVAAAVAAAVSPVWFSAVRRFGLLAPLERTFRDV